MEPNRSEDHAPVQSDGLSRREALLRDVAGGLALALLARGVDVARAQEGTPAPEGGLPPGVAIVPGTSALVEDMPPAPVQVSIYRITLEPGASVPVSTFPFPSVSLVEQGTLICPGGAGRVVIAADGSTREVGDEEVTINTGEGLYVPANVGDGARNDGTEQIV